LEYPNTDLGDVFTNDKAEALSEHINPRISAFHKAVLGYPRGREKKCGRRIGEKKSKEGKRDIYTFHERTLIQATTTSYLQITLYSNF
jgi:hypothetical protein